ncbi:hypothetical protein E5F05_14995 [Deinococcus metallilatus]|uniref:Polyferredoxin n=1 Tax=Deinococcus metallilatus TaxID=1211322 RepID=A0AAJ5K400_9DEIO|nr:hypothetical protein [Deinococcus metallilatus]MBB5296786.1 polyferredoxin [Deinococcus metallilatus]QBY09147.1 hypothetical protein E5F05_14995 [Deinococcus metallilatus]RXJ09662.1 hypothetical protein ERJ73_13825 [Deinococcus metallilatus]TLK24128.1 hypothetical protein FCS05_14785 [Deinococcus metallilatus]
MDAVPLFFVLSPLGLLLLALLLIGVALMGVTYLVPRRFWGWLLLIGCPLLTFGPVVLALLLDLR